MMPDEKIRWLPTGAVAKILRISNQRVLQLISDGKLVADMVSGRWMISRASVEARIALLKEQEEH